MKVWGHATGHAKQVQEALGVRKGHVGRGGPVALIICDDFHAVVLPHADTAVRGAKILTAAGYSAMQFMTSGFRVLGGPKQMLRTAYNLKVLDLQRTAALRPRQHSKVTACDA